MLSDSTTPELSLPVTPVAVPPETPTGQSRRAYRLAAAILVVGGLMNLAFIVLSHQAASVVSSLIDLGLAIGLYQLRPGARGWVLLRAVLGLILFSILSFVGNDLLTGILGVIVQAGYSGSLILLLTGKSQTVRLATGVGIFVVFTLSCLCFAIVVQTSGAAP